jgi:hypothetical protein
MNNYSDDYLNQIEEANQEFDINARIIKQFERESKRKKIDGKKKKIKLEEKE